MEVVHQLRKVQSKKTKDPFTYCDLRSNGLKLGKGDEVTCPKCIAFLSDMGIVIKPKEEK